jgi:hypothetical protein
MRYATDTHVSVEKSRSEIEATINRYGATGFISGWQGNQAMVTFEMRDRRLKFLLPLPDRTEDRFKSTPGGRKQRSDYAALAAWEQACRQLWRPLALAIKAKLEAVECGISEFDSEFMANTVLPNGMTVGETLLPKMAHIVKTGKLPPLLPGPGVPDANKFCGS